MAVQISDVNAMFPQIKLKVNEKITELQAFPDHAVRLVKKGTPKATNPKGAREILKIGENTEIGAIGEGGTYPPGGGRRAVEMLIGYVPLSISGKVTGDRIAAAKDAIGAGGMIGGLMMDDYKSLRKQEDINFCLGDGLFRRGTVLSFSVSTNTTVTFESAAGAYYIVVGQFYFIHHPTTFALHGGGTAFQCLSKTKTTAVFAGDMTVATTIAAGDYLVPRASGGASPESAVNRACRGFSYFAAASGDYYGVDKDNISEARGLRLNAGGDMISHPLMEQTNSLYSFRWGSAPVMSSQTDFTSPTQIEGYKLNGYPLRRVDGPSYKNYDGAIERVTDGNRMQVIDPFFADTVWYRVMMEYVSQYVFIEEGTWDLDGLEARAPQDTGGIVDALLYIIRKKNQFADINPGSLIEIFGLGTSGLVTKTT